MATVTKNFRDGSIFVHDNNSQTARAEIVDDSSVSWEETVNRVNVSDRGDLSHMRQGEEAPCTGSFGLKFKQFHGANNSVTVYEALKQAGNAASWSSTNDDGGDVYTCTLVARIAAVGDTPAEVVTFAKVCPQGAISFSEGNEYNTLQFNFQDFETAPTIS